MTKSISVAAMRPPTRQGGNPYVALAPGLPLVHTAAMSALRIFGNRSTHVRRSGVAACAAGVIALGSLIAAPTAQAAAGCTTTTPALNQTITCSVAGSETITVPAGANAVRVVVIGGGGGGGTSSGGSFAGGSGGAGAEVSGSFRIGTGGSISIVVGARGNGGQGGAGGGFSRVSDGASLLAVAGGGGGGGGSYGRQGGGGGSGAAGSTAAGGNGQDTDGSGGGGGGSAGSGGAAGVSPNGNGSTGGSWAAGGAGGVGDGGTAGSGGSGYGGGGGGSNFVTLNQSRPGGGAGGSYANPALLITTASFAPATGASGAGGAGAAAGSGLIGAAGTVGSVQLTFFYAPPDDGPVPVAPMQQVGMPASGLCADVDDAQLGWNTGIRGGWWSSWAEWLRGPVCARQFVYDASLAGWRLDR